MTKKLEQAKQTEKLSIVGKAAAKIAHELKNSLLMVNTFVDLLPERHQDEKFIQEFSRLIPNELQSWNEMLRNMMNVAKEKPYVKKIVDFNLLIKEIGALAQFRVQQNHLEIEIDQESDLPKIKGDEQKLKQVILNLLTNSLEATPKGGKIFLKTRHVYEFGEENAGHIEVTVANTGRGIKGNRLRRIFEPFYTTKGNNLGLGLSICKEIIHQHGGVIEVLSEENKGASFTVKIPTTNIKNNLFNNSFKIS
ncbi:MAG: hypothetical protein KC733_09550 [Candidatus Omnitrophica bacterium]|nr:hypothetical protein [Candidatus Omnitrophota bacterium]